jgi:hypothetical protein
MTSYYTSSAGNCNTTAGYYYGETAATSYVYWPLETDEQRERRLAEEAEARCRREEVDAKAEKLLRETFGEEYELLTKDGFVMVDSEKYQGMRYRISKCPYDRINVIDAEGKIIDSLCVMLKESCPDWDVVLAKIMLARFDEERLQEVANHSRNL